MSKHLKTGDKLLIAALLLACFAGAIWWIAGPSNLLSNTSTSTGLLVVTQAKDGYRRVDALSNQAEFTITTPGTGSGNDQDESHNTVRIENNTVRVISSNCGNQVCVDHAAISKSGEQIVCLPHGVVIEIVEHEEDASKLSWTERSSHGI